MWSTARTIAAGDLVIVWMTRENMIPLEVTPGLELNNRFGVFSHSDLIGLPYGTKVSSRNGRGFVYVLRPTPELWTLALPHRTQILYLADIAFIVSSLNIRPGSSVIEAGTGSGSFTHSVARTIGPSGTLHSYEFHEERASKARDEFAKHGMTMVQLSHRNVCQQGFALLDAADAVFLDLPAPWEAIPHAKMAMKKDRVVRICCFSPCIEQVLRTVMALNQFGFTELTMFETLLRPHDVHQVPKLITIEKVVEQVKLHDLKREQRRLEQVAASEKKRSNRKRKRDDMEGEDDPDPDLGTGDQKRKRESEPPPTSTATAANDHLEEVTTLEPPILQSSRKEARLAVLATATPMSKPLSEKGSIHSHQSGAPIATDTSWDTTTADFDQLIASIPEDELERVISGNNKK